MPIKITINSLEALIKSVKEYSESHPFDSRAKAGYLEGMNEVFNALDIRRPDGDPLDADILWDEIDDVSRWSKMSKGDLAKERLDGFVFDCALPQEWLDHQAAIKSGRPPGSERYSEVYHDILGRTVWLYDAKGGVGGRPFDLLGPSDKPAPLPAKDEISIPPSEGTPEQIDQEDRQTDREHAAWLAEESMLPDVPDNGGQSIPFKPTLHPIMSKTDIHRRENVAQSGYFVLYRWPLVFQRKVVVGDQAPSEKLDIQDCAMKRMTAEEICWLWEQDRDSGEYVQINPDGSVAYVAHGTSNQTIISKGSKEAIEGDYLPKIKAWMESSQFYPNVWRVSDHGNVDLIGQNTGESVGGIV